MMMQTLFSLLVKGRAALLAMLAIIGLAGCEKSLEVYESKKPTMAFSTNVDGTTSVKTPVLRPGILLVTGTVQRIRLPVLNSPSLVGDKATCQVQIPVNAVPNRPKTSKVVLHYDNHGWLSYLTPGAQILLRFDQHGNFDGVHLGDLQGNGSAPPKSPVQ